MGFGLIGPYLKRAMGGTKEKNQAEKQAANGSLFFSSLYVMDFKGERLAGILLSRLLIIEDDIFGYHIWLISKFLEE